MVICLELGADLHMAQLMPLPLTVSCFSKIQIDFTFLVQADPGSPGKIVCMCVCVCVRAACVRACVRVWYAEASNSTYQTSVCLCCNRLYRATCIQCTETATR